MKLFVVRYEWKSMRFSQLVRAFSESGAVSNAHVPSGAACVSATAVEGCRWRERD